MSLSEESRKEIRTERSGVVELPETRRGSEAETKKVAIAAYMAKNSKAQMLDKMEAAGMCALDISVIQRLPISLENQMNIVDDILFAKTQE